MAFMNLIKASINGKLGTQYGVKNFGKACLKQIPFSHTPHNKLQKASWSAFTTLVRFASGFTRYFWRVLPLKSGKAYNHNVTTQWLKPMISQHTFSLEKIKDIIPTGNTVLITSHEYDKNTNIVSINWENNIPFEPGKIVYFNACLVNEIGLILSGSSSYNPQLTMNLPVLEKSYMQLYIVAFSSIVSDNKKVVGNANVILIDTSPVIEGTWFTSLQKWEQEPYVNQETLIMPETIASYENGTMFTYDKEGL